MKRDYSLKITKRHPSLLKLKVYSKIDSLPTSVDLRQRMPPVYDQGQLGSCTANALAAAFEFDDANAWTPSRLFIYYNERMIENDVGVDGGAQISDGVNSLETYGVCQESSWPYDISQFAIKPSESCYTEALANKAFTVENIPDDEVSIKTSLVNGFPVVVGIQVYASFESQDVASSGIVPMPDTSSEECLGGHAVLIVGYDDASSSWLMRNSWGTSWGMAGYFTLPYAYISTYGSDLWNITKISSSDPRPTPDDPIQAQLEDLKNQINDLQSQIDAITQVLM
jgi:C1A family cysteine protease